MLLSALLPGCGRTVTVEPLPIADDAGRDACEAILAALPEQLSAGRAWAVQPDPGTTAAWGSPPVVLRCGDGLPQPQPTDQLLQVQGVTWLVTTLTRGEQYSTVDRSPGVMVTVPDEYRPTAAVLAELALFVAGSAP